jgi:hypothetical protein
MVGATTVVDRGRSYVSSYYDQYVQAVGSRRHTAAIGDKIILDESSTNPVTIEIVEVNEQGLQTTNENDLSQSTPFLFQ